MCYHWLNLTSPCIFATVDVSDKGKIKKVYRNKNANTPLECLVLFDKTGLVSFSKAKEKIDLFALINRPGQRNPT